VWWLWICGQRVSVVQAKRHIHSRLLDPRTPNTACRSGHEHPTSFPEAHRLTVEPPQPSARSMLIAIFARIFAATNSRSLMGRHIRLCERPLHRGGHRLPLICQLSKPLAREGVGAAVSETRHWPRQRRKASSWATPGYGRERQTRHAPLPNPSPLRQNSPAVDAIPLIE
jgi:hypothetical protein